MVLYVYFATDSTLAVRSIQPPRQWPLGTFLQCLNSRCLKLSDLLHLFPRLRIRGSKA